MRARSSSRRRRRPCSSDAHALHGGPDGGDPPPRRAAAHAARRCPPAAIQPAASRLFVSPRCPFASARCDIEKRRLAGDGAACVRLLASGCPVRGSHDVTAPMSRTINAAPDDKPLLTVDNLSWSIRSASASCSASRPHGETGETLGLVGESGCGKSTGGRAILQLPKPTPAASCSTAMSSPPRSRPAAAAARCQIIFQDPIASLNPRRRIATSSRSRCASPAYATRPRAQRRVREVLEASASIRDRRWTPPAPVLRRPVPAHLHRPSARPGARPPDLRRAGVGARRLGAGADPEPPRGHEGALRADADLHRPRPRGREEGQRPRRRHVSRPALRGRGRSHLRRPAHPYTARCSRPFRA